MPFIRKHCSWRNCVLYNLVFRYILIEGVLQCCNLKLATRDILISLYACTWTLFFYLDE